MPAADRLECMEIWGGNQAADRAIAVSGMDAWVLSEPYGGDAAGGGDIHFVSTCGHGRIARFLLADVAGHGRLVNDVAIQLLRLMRKHMNRLDQTRFIRELNREFSELADKGMFATALMASYYAPTEHLVVCNAGHPRPFWYRSRLGTWHRLEHAVAGPIEGLANLPLGIIESTDYDQFAVRLEPGDLVLLYSDAAIEARNSRGELLGEDGLLERLRHLDPTPPERFHYAVLQDLSNYRGHEPADDDLTVVLLHHNAGQPPRQSFSQMVKVMGKMAGLVKV